MSPVLVHIGAHKTGTTAFQLWASSHAASLETGNGIRYFEGLRGPSHFELALLAVASGRTLPCMALEPDWPLAAWRAAAVRHVGEQLAMDDRKILVSSEDLSLLRSANEVERLRGLFAPRELRVAVCLRSRDDWLRSYGTELRRHFHVSEFPESHGYIGADTWLTDWDAMLRAWRGVLGADNVVAVDYDDSVRRYGSSIPGVLTALGIDPDAVPPWQGVVANVTSGVPGRFPQAQATGGDRLRHARGRIEAVRQQHPVGWPLHLVRAAFRRGR